MTDNKTSTHLRRLVLVTSASLAVAMLGGCAGLAPLPANSDFGPRPVAYEEAIKTHMERSLKDPDSARYRFGQPRKGYANKGMAFGGQVIFVGYIVPVQINAKNSFGGYTGFKPFQAMVYGGTRGVLGLFDGASHPLVHEVE